MRLDLKLPQAGPKALSAALHRLKPAHGCIRTYALQVPVSTLDFNGHVNNTEYVRWALDALHLALGRTPEIRAVHVTYLAEAFQGDQIEVLVSPGSHGHIGIVERKPQSPAGTDVCLMEVLC
jgi:hypothetical protein